MTPDRRTLLALFSLAFGLRMLFAAAFGANPDIVTVRETYDFQIAARMSQNLSWVTTPFSPNAPGYLMLLAAAFAVFGVSWWTAITLNAVLGGLTTFFLYRIGEKRIGPGAGLYAAVWFGLMAHQIFFASFVVRDVTVIFLLSWFMYNLVTPFRRMRTALWLAFLYTLLVMTEPLFLVMLPVLILFLVFKATHHRTLSVQYLFLFLVFLLFFNIPWTARNYAVHGEFVPVSIKAERYTHPVMHLLQYGNPLRKDDLPEGYVVREPGFVHNTVEFWRVMRLHDAPADPEHGVNAEPAWSLRHNVISVVTYGLLLPFFATGVILALVRRHRAALILSGAILSYATVRGFMTGDDHPRGPVEPLIILVAMYALRELLKIRNAVSLPADRG